MQSQFHVKANSWFVRVSWGFGNKNSIYKLFLICICHCFHSHNFDILLLQYLSQYSWSSSSTSYYPDYHFMSMWFPLPMASSSISTSNLGISPVFQFPPMALRIISNGLAFQMVSRIIQSGPFSRISHSGPVRTTELSNLRLPKFLHPRDCAPLEGWLPLFTI